MAGGTVGKVFLVGAGPGDPELITLKGKRCLEAAAVILYDELVNADLLDYAAAGAERIYVGKKAGAHCADQSTIEALLIDRARRGSDVVRLKGGDPFVFGRGGEEAQALRAAGIAFEIVPGVSSAIGVPAYAGIPLTHRLHGSSVAVVTGHRAAGNPVRWGEILRAVDTLVILMGLTNLTAIMNRLQSEGCPPERPAAVIQAGTLPEQRIGVGTVANIAELCAHAGFASPAIIVVGEVARFANHLGWFSATVTGPRFDDHIHHVSG